MEALLVPGEVARSSATLWVALTSGIPTSDPVEVEQCSDGRRWPVEAWQRWQAPGAAPAFTFARVRVDALQPATPYAFRLRASGTRRAIASLTTLPLALPPVTAPPFTVLVGSCFSVLTDGSGNVGRAFTLLPGALTPQIKILVGDQVYLDSPWYRFAIPQPASRLASGFLQHYLRTWTQRGDLQGFGRLLAQGANYFCADDHEFWNNVPFPSSVAMNTWTASGRQTWQALAHSLYRAFQHESTPAMLDIGELSVCIMDTRVHRTRDRSRFASVAALQRLQQWVEQLRAPGLLVLSQPIFATRAGAAGRYVDWNLPDFEQYALLCRVLLSSRQSIIVASGDVHFGRIAQATLPSGAELIEIVSSPMALVAGAARGAWQAAPSRFPAEPIPGIASTRVTTHPRWHIADDHFVTLHFHADGGGVRCGVRAWPTRTSADAPVHEVTFDLTKGTA